VTGSEHDDHVPAIRDRLHDRAHVFEDPDSYVAGVDDALEIVQALEEDDEPPA
jgi:hypothetical protein